MTNGVATEFPLTPIYDELQNSLYEDRNIDIEDILHRPKWDFEQACARVQESVERALKGPRRDASGRFRKSLK